MNKTEDGSKLVRGPGGEDGVDLLLHDVSINAFAAAFPGQGEDLGVRCVVRQVGSRSAWARFATRMAPPEVLGRLKKLLPAATVAEIKAADLELNAAQQVRQAPDDAPLIEDYPLLPLITTVLENVDQEGARRLFAARVGRDPASDRVVRLAKMAYDLEAWPQTAPGRELEAWFKAMGEVAKQGAKYVAAVAAERELERVGGYEPGTYPNDPDLAVVQALDSEVKALTKHLQGFLDGDHVRHVRLGGRGRPKDSPARWFAAHLMFGCQDRALSYGDVALAALAVGANPAGGTDSLSDAWEPLAKDARTFVQSPSEATAPSLGPGWMSFNGLFKWLIALP